MTIKTNTKDIAFLRGINVGGKNIIKMVDLKGAFERCGMENVSTFIQSGNVIFETEKKSIHEIVAVLEETLSKSFNYQSRIVVLSQSQLKRVVAESPLLWEKNVDARCYIAFVKEPFTPQDILKEITLKEGVDSVEIGKGVLYMTTLFSGITKSGFSKLIGTSVYKQITIRNYNTARKILARMEIG
jgi:uncharacterized protein (DUF1697 family)